MINIDQIKKLRQETGAGVVDIKKALEQSGGSEEEAKKVLREAGFARAAKKAERAVGAGVVETYIHSTATSAATVVLACETDFVARTPQFKSLAKEIAMQATAMDPKDTNELLSQAYIRDESKTVGQLIGEHIAKFGENIKVKDFKRFEV